ncbi:cupredoxin domain-containing protein [Streptomyces sp. INA 01156]
MSGTPGRRRRRPHGPYGTAARAVGTVAGTVLTVLAVLVANSGGNTGGSHVVAGTAGGGTKVVRTVAVTLTDMRVRPDRIEVAAGTALRLKVTNTDAQRHDLEVEDGPTTPMLAGATAMCSTSARSPRTVRRGAPCRATGRPG